MIAGRWRDAVAPIHKKLGLAAFDFPHGSVMLTKPARRSVQRCT
jgi:hypothetical protein